MMYVIEALGVMLAVTLAVHLGLTDAITKVVVRIAQCYMCLTFWVSVVVLPMVGVPLALTPLLAIVCAYLSNWLMVLFVLLQDLYDSTWQSVIKQKNFRRKRRHRHLSRSGA